jgi:hypothetical protein
LRAVVLVHFLVMYGCARTLLAFGEATPAEAIEIRDGFVVERVYSVPREQGSWVAMCCDNKGRIYASDQGIRLFRITPLAPDQTSENTVELVSDRWGFSQGMTFLPGALYVVQHGDHSESSFRPDVLLRIKDTNPNDPGGSEVRFSMNDLESTTPSRVSFMPEGLLNTLSHEDILDLIAYLRQR